jgi:hypothetical protein
MLPLLALVAMACDEDGSQDDSSGPNMSECEGEEVVVSHFGPGGVDDVVDECVPIPEACEDGADCADDACIEALYGLCESPSVGAGCSSVGDDTFVSCNE